MSRPRIAAALVGGALLLAAVSSPPLRAQAKPAAAKTAASSSAADYEKRLAAIRSDILRLRAKLGDEEKREKTALSQLDRLAVNKRLLRSEWSLLQVQLARTRADRDAIGRSIPEMREALAADRDRLARVLQTLYKHGRFSVARYALEARDLRAFVDQVRALEIIADSQDRVIADFTARLTELGRADRELREKEADIAALTGQSAAKQKEIEAEEGKKGPRRPDQDQPETIRGGDRRARPAGPGAGTAPPGPGNPAPPDRVPRAPVRRDEGPARMAGRRARHPGLRPPEGKLQHEDREQRSRNRPARRRPDRPGDPRREGGLRRLLPELRQPPHPRARRELPFALRPPGRVPRPQRGHRRARHAPGRRRRFRLPFGRLPLFRDPLPDETRRSLALAQAKMIEFFPRSRRPR